MRSLSFFGKSKKGFTLVELLAVMVIMAIATAIVLPNIRGMISKTEEATYKSLCVEATSYVRSYCNMLTLGEETVPYEKNGETKTYTITSPSGLTNALNEYNLEVKYQFYVLAFESSSATANPTSSLAELFSNGKLSKKDVMITVISTSQGKNDRVATYTVCGFWYYDYTKEAIVYSYYAPSKRGNTGFKKLTSSGK